MVDVTKSGLAWYVGTRLEKRYTSWRISWRLPGGGRLVHANESHLPLPVADAAASAFTVRHRALPSLRGELEAIGWYAQRAEACADDSLRAVIDHNKGEVVDHAIMLLECIRRNNPVFDANIRRYLLGTGAIVPAEDSAEQPGAGSVRLASNASATGSCRTMGNQSAGDAGPLVAGGV